MKVRIAKPLRSQHRVLAVGDTPDLPPRLAVPLIQNGFAVQLEGENRETMVQRPSEIKHCGGPWYEVDGKKYRGKKAALEAANGGK